MAVQLILVKTEGVGTPSGAVMLRTLGGVDTDEALGVAVDTSGNWLIAGEGSDDGYLSKYNSSGAIQWQRRLTGGNQNFVDGIVGDSSGNVISVGRNRTSSTWRASITKHNSSGVLQWKNYFGGDYGERFWNVGVDGSGNIYAVGDSDAVNFLSSYAYTEDAIIVKYDPSGNVVWKKRLYGSNSSDKDVAHGIAVTSAGNVYVSIRAVDISGTDDGIIIAKYNNAGALQWQRGLHPASAEGCKIALDASENVYVGFGSTLSVAKYNSAGTIQWQRTLTGSGGLCKGCAVDTSDNVYIAGSDGRVAKYNSSGVLQWQNRLTPSVFDIEEICIADADHLLAVCSTITNTQGGRDQFIARLPLDGSGTGTYGSFTYAATAHADGAGSYTDIAGPLIDHTEVLLGPIANTQTESAGVLTDVDQTT